MKEKNEQGYTLKKVIETPGAAIRVFSPILTDEERARRMNAIHKATARLLGVAMGVNQGSRRIHNGAK